MKDRGRIEPVVEQVVAQVLESHAVQLRSEIVRRVVEEIEAVPASSGGSPSGAGSVELARAVAEIQLGTSQREILRALLDGCARCAARVALFVVKGGGQATGWQGRGFSSAEAVKDFTLDVNAPAVARAIGDRVVVSAGATDLDARFLQEFGRPAGEEGRFLPLVLKDKVAALVYADGGSEGTGSLDTSALELLVLSAGAWLEVNALRKQAHKESAAEHGEGHAVVAAAAAPSYDDPFAAHAPGHAMAAAASVEASSAPVVAAVESQPAAAEELQPVVAAAVVEAPLAAADVASPEEQDIHRKAQRFARLLVDEIKLYNQAKVFEGRKSKDLYDRLKDAIEKSRSTYQKRYGNTAAASGDYFQHEVIRSLAEDDVSSMGSNFKH